MTYRTKTYIAADWEEDQDAVEQLYSWKKNNNLSLDFNDAHALRQARDESLNCSIKKSLSDRFNVSSTFVLIVGSTTKTIRSGSCQYCNSLNSYTDTCARGNSVDYRSYIQFECEKAVRNRLKIVVLYKATIVDKSKCPDAVKYTGYHIPMYYYRDGKYYWDYNSVKSALL